VSAQGHLEINGSAERQGREAPNSESPTGLDEVCRLTTGRTLRATAPADKDSVSETRLLTRTHRQDQHLTSAACGAAEVPRSQPVALTRARAAGTAGARVVPGRRRHQARIVMRQAAPFGRPSRYAHTPRVPAPPEAFPSSLFSSLQPPETPIRA
jgi:hypothetical protein